MQANKKTLAALLRAKDGTTITSVIVAFVVLLAVAMFVGVVRLSKQLVLRADETRGEVFELMQKYYCNELTPTRVAPAADSGEETVSFALHEDAKNTSFQLITTVYEYDLNGYRLYSFGEHSLP